MTKHRDLKRLVRARAAKTGESYQAARRQVVGDDPHPGLSAEHEEAVLAYFDGWERYLATWRATGGRWEPYQVDIPIDAMQAAALRHPNARIRRACLGILDHHANEESAGVFLEALRDPVPRVRIIALHGFSCERCRIDELDVNDAVGALLRSLASDPSAKVRHAAVQTIARFLDRDDRVASALEHLGSKDPDDLIRLVALAVVSREHVDVRSRKALRRRARRRSTNYSTPNGSLLDRGDHTKPFS